MRVTFNVNREVAEYFKDCNLELLVSKLLDKYEMYDLPEMSKSNDRVQKTVEVTHPLYLVNYKIFGPRSKKNSLGRLLEFAYNNQYPVPASTCMPMNIEDTAKIRLENAIRRALKTLSLEQIINILEKELL